MVIYMTPQAPPDDEYHSELGGWWAMGNYDADNWSTLSVAERIKLCRMAAHQAEADARFAEPDLQRLYKGLAAHWRLLAVEIERHDYGPSQEAFSSLGS